MGDLPCGRVGLSFSCRNLAKMDINSNSDPMIVVFSSRPHLSGEWYEVARTEMIRDNHNPDFVTHVVMDYFFEEVQPLRIVCVDVDDPKSANLKHQDYIGSFETRLATLFTAPGLELTGPLTHNNKTRGVVTIRGEELVDLKQDLALHLAGANLDRKDFFGKSDPFLKFFRARESGSWEAVHSTEIIKQDLNPVWKPFQISVVKLCNGDLDRPIRVECHDWDSDGSTDYIGSFQTSARQLTGETKEYALINEKKKKNGGVAGHIRILDVKVVQQYSFLDYIAGGCEVSLITAIDFTASNGEPYDPQSLHYIPPDGSPTKYEQAILAVGNILVPYDSDHIVPTYGFGAKWGGSISHCFPLVEGGCHGVEGILQAYRNCVQNVKLYGPTIFQQVIDLAAREAQGHMQSGSHTYTILLILTDGVITDMDASIRSIVNASALPLSIIIVGIGPADFTDMNRLDSDDKLLRSGGVVAKRDIVQFVPFRDFQSRPFEALAKHTLAEVPGQFMAYMKSNNVAPPPPRAHVAPSAPPA